MTQWNMYFSQLDNSNLMLIYALAMVVFFTLIKARKRLIGQPFRFAGVVIGHVFLVALISAWSWGLAIPTKGQTQVAIDSETWLKAHQHGAKLLAQYPSIEKLALKGYGFTKTQWQDLVEVTVDFTPKHVDAGFANMRWTQQLYVGESFTVKGIWLNPAVPSKVVNVHLIDIAGIKVASTRVRHGENIALKSSVKAPGNFAFELQALDDDGQQLDIQSLYVNVTSSLSVQKENESKLSVLVMQSAPSFEVNQLKNWLGSFEAQMVIFTDISKARFITQAVNRDKQSLPQNLSPQLLESMDVLIMDGRKLANLNANDGQMVAQAVEQGLGLLVFADSDFVENTPKWLEAFNINAVSGNARERRILPVVNGIQSEVSFSLMPYEFNTNSSAFTLQVLEQDYKKRPLSLLKNHGLGKVAISLFNTRYQWHQQEKLHMYSSAWQQLFKGISRVERQAKFVNLNKLQNIQFINEKNSICLLSKDLQLVKDGLTLNVNGETSKLPLTQDTTHSSRYCTWHWPYQSGWHLFSFANSKGKVEQWRYVYDRQSWLTHQQNRRIQDTRQFIVANKGKQRKGVSYYKLVSGHWYWWLIILCLTLLWLEGRTNGHKPD